MAGPHGFVSKMQESLAGNTKKTQEMIDKEMIKLKEEVFELINSHLGNLIDDDMENTSDNKTVSSAKLKELMALRAWSNHAHKKFLKDHEIFMGGITKKRPKKPLDFQSYFDTDLGFPIWWSGKNWVDSKGKKI